MGLSDIIGRIDFFSGAGMEVGIGIEVGIEVGIWVGKDIRREVGARVSKAS